MKTISLGQCCAMSAERPLRCAEPATTERGGRPVCIAHSRRLKPSEVAAVTPQDAERIAAARQLIEADKREKSEIYWRRFSARRRTEMSWYERVVINNEITRAALAREAGTSKNAVGQAIDEIDRSIRCSQRMPWRRPKTMSPGDLKLIRSGFDKRLAGFLGVPAVATS
jgi:hypothetical protein